MGYKMFASIGHSSHQGEVYLRKKMGVDKDGDQKDDLDGGTSEEEITDAKAFEKGVDWFTEVFFFYGVLFGICWWEFKKFNQSQKNQRARLSNLEENTEKILEKLEKVNERENVQKKDLQ